MASKRGKKGSQFVNNVDMEKVCSNFLVFYYKNWMVNVDLLFKNPIWKPFTKINIDGKSMSPQDTIRFHKNLQGGKFEKISYQFVPDGSRRLDIMMKGKITKSGISKFIIQSFALIEIKGQFYLKSTQIYFI